MVSATARCSAERAPATRAPGRTLTGSATGRHARRSEAYSSTQYRPERGVRRRRKSRVGIDEGRRSRARIRHTQRGKRAPAGGGAAARRARGWAPGVALAGGGGGGVRAEARGPGWRSTSRRARVLARHGPLSRTLRSPYSARVQVHEKIAGRNSSQYTDTRPCGSPGNGFFIRHAMHATTPSIQRAYHRKNIYVCVSVCIDPCHAQHGM